MTKTRTMKWKKYLPWVLLLLVLSVFVIWIFIPAATPQKPTVVVDHTMEKRHKEYEKEMEAKLQDVTNLLSSSRDRNRSNEQRVASLSGQIKELLKLKPIQKALAQSDTVSPGEKTPVEDNSVPYSDHTAKDYEELSSKTLEHIDACDSTISGLKEEVSWQEVRAELYRQQYNGQKTFNDTLLVAYQQSTQYSAGLEKKVKKKSTESTLLKILAGIGGILYFLKK